MALNMAKSSQKPISLNFSKRSCRFPITGRMILKVWSGDLPQWILRFCQLMWAHRRRYFVGTCKFSPIKWPSRSLSNQNEVESVAPKPDPAIPDIFQTRLACLMPRNVLCILASGETIFFPTCSAGTNWLHRVVNEWQTLYLHRSVDWLESQVNEKWLLSAASFN